MSSARAVLDETRLSRCGRCGELKPRTTEHFYFAATGYRTGYCKPCQAAYGRAYWPTATAYQRERRRRQQRAWWRDHRGRRAPAQEGTT
jgi:hypothetical protein